MASALTILTLRNRKQRMNRQRQRKSPLQKKGAAKATVLKDDDLDEMLEWLKGELENLEDEQDD